MEGSVRKTKSQMERSRSAVGLDGALDRLLGHSRHDEQFLLEVVEALVKA